MSNEELAKQKTKESCARNYFRMLKAFIFDVEAFPTFCEQLLPYHNRTRVRLSRHYH